MILRGQIGPAERKPHGVHKFPLLICQAAAVSRVDQVVPRGHRPDADELVFPRLRRDPQQLFPQRHPITSLQIFLQFITKYPAGQDGTEPLKQDNRQRSPDVEQPHVFFAILVRVTPGRCPAEKVPEIFIPLPG